MTYKHTNKLVNLAYRCLSQTVNKYPKNKLDDKVYFNYTVDDVAYENYLKVAEKKAVKTLYKLINSGDIGNKQYTYSKKDLSDYGWTNDLLEACFDAGREAYYAV